MTHGISEAETTIPGGRTQGTESRSAYDAFAELFRAGGRAIGLGCGPSAGLGDTLGLTLAERPRLT